MDGQEAISRRSAENGSDAETEESVSVAEIAVLILAVVSVATLIALTIGDLSEEMHRLIQLIDFGVCTVFATKFLIDFMAAPNKAAYLRWGWIDLLAAIPAIDALRTLRLVGVLRLIRALRAAHGAMKIIKNIKQHRKTNALAAAFYLSAIAIITGAVGILWAEQEAPDANITTAEDALWWTITTITTVGYGDHYPVTGAGRMVAVGLMTVGIGLFGVLTGVCASFVTTGSPSPSAED